MGSTKRSSALRLCVYTLLLLLLPSELVAAEAEPAVGEPGKATKKIPRRQLQQVLGCWQLDGQERWTISRLDLNGAQVTTKIIKRKPPMFPDWVRRSSLPATLMYDPVETNFGFATPGRVRPTLVLFKRSGTTLEASLYSKRSAKDHFAATGNTVTLQRCRTVARTHTRHRPEAVTPPRLK